MRSMRLGATGQGHDGRDTMRVVVLILLYVCVVILGHAYATPPMLVVSSRGGVALFDGDSVSSLLVSRAPLYRNDEILSAFFDPATSSVLVTDPAGEVREVQPFVPNTRYTVVNTGGNHSYWLYRDSRTGRPAVLHDFIVRPEETATQRYVVRYGVDAWRPLGDGDETLAPHFSVKGSLIPLGRQTTEELIARFPDGPPLPAAHRARDWRIVGRSRRLSLYVLDLPAKERAKDITQSRYVIADHERRTTKFHVEPRAAQGHVYESAIALKIGEQRRSWNAPEDTGADWEWRFYLVDSGRWFKRVVPSTMRLLHVEGDIAYFGFERALYQFTLTPSAPREPAKLVDLGFEAFRVFPLTQ